MATIWPRRSTGPYWRGAPRTCWTPTVGMTERRIARMFEEADGFLRDRAGARLSTTAPSPQSLLADLAWDLDFKPE